MHIENYIYLKSTLEAILGESSWYKLKESTHLPTWKKELNKIISAIEFSINVTVDVYDPTWKLEIKQIIENGRILIKKSTNIEEAISILAVVFIKLSFLQVGLVPNRRNNNVLTKEHWKLDRYRTVIYVQTNEQKENLFYSQQQREIGFEKQRRLISDYKKSNSELPYSLWCLDQETH